MQEKKPIMEALIMRLLKENKKKSYQEISAHLNISLNIELHVVYSKIGKRCV